MIASTRCGCPCASALSMRLLEDPIHGDLRERRHPALAAEDMEEHRSAVGPGRQELSDRADEPSALTEREQSGDDITELVGRLGCGGPASSARAGRGLRLSGQASPDQLRLERRIGEALHRPLEDDPGGLLVLDVGDLVDLARGLAVPAGALVRVGDGLARHLGELPAHGAQKALLGGEVGRGVSGPRQLSSRGG